MKRSILILSALLIPIITKAQTSYPFIDFETNRTTPNVKSFASEDTINTNGVKWIMPGVRLGAADQSDFKIDDRSARFGRKSEQSGTNGCMQMVENFTAGLHDIYFKAAMYGNGTGGQIEVAYSQNNGSTWIVTDTFNIPPNNAPQTFNVHEHVGGHIRLRLCKVDATNHFINIDSLIIEPLGELPTTLTVLDLHPHHNDVVFPDTAATLDIVYNQRIQANSGSITLRKIGGATQVFDLLTSPNVVVGSDRVEIINVRLDPESHYEVTATANLVESEFGNLFSSAINPGQWEFYTSIAHYDSFTVANDGCNTVQDTLDNIFRRISVLGTDKWNCVQDGNRTVYLMEVNEANGRYSENLDWLITRYPVKVDTNTIFSFEEAKDGYSANTTMELFYATTFNGQVNRTNWTKIATLGTPIQNNTYESRSYQLANLGINENVYLGFKYSSENATNEEPKKWKLSNIQLINPTGNTSVHKINDNIGTIGFVDANEGMIKLYAAIKNAGDYEFEVLDITGRVIAKWQDTLKQGEQVLQYPSFTVTSGVYLIAIKNQQGFMSLKVML